MQQNLRARDRGRSFPRSFQLISYEPGTYFNGRGIRHALSTVRSISASRLGEVEIGRNGKMHLPASLFDQHIRARCSDICQMRQYAMSCFNSKRFKYRSQTSSFASGTIDQALQAQGAPAPLLNQEQECKLPIIPWRLHMRRVHLSASLDLNF